MSFLLEKRLSKSIHPFSMNTTNPVKTSVLLFFFFLSMLLGNKNDTVNVMFLFIIWFYAFILVICKISVLLQWSLYVQHCILLPYWGKNSLVVKAQNWEASLIKLTAKALSICLFPVTIKEDCTCQLWKALKVFCLSTIIFVLCLLLKTRKYHCWKQDQVFKHLNTFLKYLEIIAQTFRKLIHKC